MGKHIFQTLTLLLASALLTTAACKKDDNNSTPSLPVNLPSGTWKLTYFWDDKDETAYFADYSFDFQSNGTATATNGSTTVPGTWADGNDDSKQKLILNFQATGKFEELNEDWEIVSQTNTKIELRHVSGGNGGTDFLTFEKI